MKHLDLKRRARLFHMNLQVLKRMAIETHKITF